MDKKFIGLNAGIIWRIISDQQKWKYSELKQKSGLPDKELYAAIGWLAREDKIEIEHGEDGNEDTFYLQFNMYIRYGRCATTSTPPTITLPGLPYWVRAL